MANDKNPSMDSMAATELAVSPIGFTLPYPTVVNVSVLKKNISLKVP